MSGLFIFISLLLLVGLIIWLDWRDQKKTRAGLQALADRLGLQLATPASPFRRDWAVTGLLQGHAVRFWTYTTGSGKSRQTWCAVGVRPQAHAGLQFEIRRQNLSTKVMEWFGAKEIQLGDAAFDRAWFVQTNQPEFFAAALVPEIREKFTALETDSPEGSYKMADGEVRFALSGSFSGKRTVAQLEARLPVLHDLADVAEVFAADDDES